MIGNPTFADNLISKLTAYEKQMEDFVLQIFASDELQDLATRLNEEQLQAGIRSDGTRVEPPYQPMTIRIKKKKGQPTDRVTLKDYGDFYAGFRLKQYPTSKKMEIISQDPKSEELQDKYNPEILGLTDENINKLRQYMFPLILAHSNKLLR